MNAAIETSNSDKLLTKLKNGDDCAFSELVETYWEKIYNRANSLLSNHQDAEEVAPRHLSESQKKHRQFQGRLLHIDLALPHSHEPGQKQALVLVAQKALGIRFARILRRRKRGHEAMRRNSRRMRLPGR